jgi:hypothetical protein
MYVVHGKQGDELAMSISSILVTFKSKKLVFSVVTSSAPIFPFLRVHIPANG